MKSCCNQSSPSYFSIALWFFVTTIFNPSIFLCILPFPKQIFLYHIPERNVMMLHILPYIAFALCLRVAYLAILSLIAYLCKNNVGHFLLRKIMPCSIVAVLWQMIKVAIGATNLYWYTMHGMDTTIMALAFLLLIALITILSVFNELIGIYKIITRKYA